MGQEATRSQVFTDESRVIERWAQTAIQSAPDWMEDDRPSLLLIAPDALHSPLHAMIDAAGARSLGSVTIDAAQAWLSQIVDVDVVMLDATRGDRVPPVLLASLATLAAQDDTVLVIATAIDTIDAMMAAIETDHAPRPDTLHWLCAPDAGDWASALVLAVDRKRLTPALEDSGRERDTERLEKLSQEIERLSRVVETMRAGDAFLPDDPAPDRVQDRPSAFASQQRPVGCPMIPIGNTGRDGNPGEMMPEEMMDVAKVRHLLRARRLRDQYMGEELFADPAWDMMLDLMAARLSGTRVSVSSLCIAAAVPPTTALRWIRQLTERGIFERRPDPHDGRRIFIALSDSAANAMHRWHSASRKARGEGPI